MRLTTCREDYPHNYHAFVLLQELTHKCYNALTEIQYVIVFYLLDPSY